jgi:hypothetical protein
LSRMDYVPKGPIGSLLEAEMVGYSALQ